MKRILTLLKDINVKDEIEKIDHNPHLRGVTPRYLKEVQISDSLTYFNFFDNFEGEISNRRGCKWPD